MDVAVGQEYEHMLTSMVLRIERVGGMTLRYRVVDRGVASLGRGRDDTVRLAERPAALLADYMELR